MANKTFDLDDYISQRKEKDPEFAKDFDTGYKEFKIGMYFANGKSFRRYPIVYPSKSCICIRKTA